jgi:hypothetical protein
MEEQEECHLQAALGNLLLWNVTCSACPQWNWGNSVSWGQNPVAAVHQLPSPTLPLENETATMTVANPSAHPCIQGPWLGTVKGPLGKGVSMCLLGAS